LRCVNYNGSLNFCALCTLIPTTIVGVKREREEEVEDAVRRVCVELDCGLGPEYVSERLGPGGSQLPYLKGHYAVNLTNLFFRVNN
jgi:recombination DNA repair RAD52 pathway protein